ncbi:DUF4164 domain-containing protein [Bartonella sp. DGB2]|uniref:DUF4164 domain-containing protein n=1 Tax=Bartonella sp. DGB2 TaxID=3388426 RepID=UPI00398F903F
MRDLISPTDQDAPHPESTADQALISARLKLEKALTKLEQTLNQQRETNQDIEGLEEEIQRMNNDRSRLAQELDQSEARAERLEQANKAVSKRLITAMETIRTVIEHQ